MDPNVHALEDIPSTGLKSPVHTPRKDMFDSQLIRLYFYCPLMIRNPVLSFLYMQDPGSHNVQQ
jgi:hypothetical protein